MTMNAPVAKAQGADFSRLWSSLSRLTAAGRWRDAIVTLTAVAESTGSLEVRISLGTVLAESGDLLGAVTVWSQAIEQARATADRESLAAIYHNLAAMYRDLGDCELALLFQRQSLSFQETCGAPELLQLTNDALHRGSWSRAEMLLEAAEDALQEDPQLEAESFSADLQATRGLLEALQGQTASGIRHVRAAIATHRQQQDWQRLGRDLLNLAAMLESEGRPGLALLCLHAARRYATDSYDAVTLNRIHFAERRCQRAQIRQQFRPEFN